MMLLSFANGYEMNTANARHALAHLYRYMDAGKKGRSWIITEIVKADKAGQIPA